MPRKVLFSQRKKKGSVRGMKGRNELKIHRNKKQKEESGEKV
jgi:hypothetical protein